MPDGDDDPTVSYRVRMLEGMVSRHGQRLDAVEDRWLRLDGAFSLMKLTIGTSIVSATVAIIAIISMITGKVT